MPRPRFVLEHPASSTIAFCSLEERRKVSASSLVFRLDSALGKSIVRCMVFITYEMSQPGRTGNVGVLRIVNAAQRTSVSADPIGHRSVVVNLRSVGSSDWSSMLRLPPPVSMGLRAIETGGANLVQRQSPWAFAAARCRSKSPIVRLHGGHVASNRVLPASDPRSGKQRSSRDVEWRPKKRSRWSLPCCQSLTAVRSNVNDRARPAL
jgi:hypothetical protein